MATTRHFSVAIEREGDVAVVAVHGEADLATVPEFATYLWRVIDAAEPRVLVDLCETRFIDSKMVELLLSAAARVRQYDGAMAIACGSENICRVLELCGVARTIAVRPVRDDALAVLAR
jgi:anti-sigma B factor antagonist